jgi:hypothetical protein
MKQKQKKLNTIVFITLLTSLIWTVSCDGDVNDMICVCYIYENGLQTRIDEDVLDNGAFTSDIKLRKECEAQSYFIDDDNYSSCQVVPMAGGSGITN